MWVAFCAVASSRRLQPFYPKHTFHLKESPFPVAWGGGVPSRRPAARQSAPSPVGSHAAPAQEGCEEGPSGLWGERQPPPSAASFPSSCSSCSSLFVLFFKTFLIQNWASISIFICYSLLIVCRMNLGKRRRKFLLSFLDETALLMEGRMCPSIANGFAGSLLSSQLTGWSRWFLSPVNDEGA